MKLRWPFLMIYHHHMMIAYCDYNLGLSFRDSFACLLRFPFFTFAHRLSALAEYDARRIVVTHGTDTMIDTAEWVRRNGCSAPKGGGPGDAPLAGKTVVFTGAMKPERFRDSDAAFNLGVAVGACNALPAGSGVYVCMNGQVLRSDKVVRDLDSGLFLPVV